MYNGLFRDAAALQLIPSLSTGLGLGLSSPCRGADPTTRKVITGWVKIFNGFGLEKPLQPTFSAEPVSPRRDAALDSSQACVKGVSDEIADTELRQRSMST